MHPDLDAWIAYARDLGKLARLARMPPTPRRIEMSRSLEDRLAGPASALARDHQRATTLRTALTIGSERLLCCLSPCPPSSVSLTSEDWIAMIQNASADDFRRALDLGLKIDDADLAVLFTHAHKSEEIASVLIDAVAKAQWWFGESTGIAKLWFSIVDPDLAAAFLRAQCAAHPEKANYCFYTHMSVGSYLAALIVQRAGGASPAAVTRHGDPAISLRQRVRSNHERLAWEKRHADLETIHRAYTRR